MKVFAPHHGNLKFSIKAAEGENVHDLTERSDALQDLLECACGGISACSTCHVILDKNVRFPSIARFLIHLFISSIQDYDKLEQPEEAELDMLDLAWGVTSTSRLGCQLNLNKDSNNMTIIIPEKSNNLF